MKTLLIITSFLLLIIFSSCQSPVEYQPVDEYLYFNSFESPQDTTGWWGYASIRLHNDAPPQGGNHSLYVSGGCIYPHAVYDFGPFPVDMEVTIEAWGKLLQGSGGVGVDVNFLDHDKSGSIGFSVDQPEWTFYQSDESLSVKRGEKLSIHINAGGFVAGTILVDLLTIREIK